MACKSPKGITAMPGATSNKAPTFSSESPDSSLLEFFDHFEELADAFELTDPERCRSLVRYVDQPTKRFWISLDEFGTHNYQKFKDAILDYYPGASTKYSIRDLERLAKTWRDDEITSETDLLRYYREFRPIANWLVTNREISKDERNRYFWYGLHPSTRRQIDRRLEIGDPNYTRSEVADMDKVLAAGRFVFSDEAFDPECGGRIANRLEKEKGKGGGRERKGQRAMRDWDSDDDGEEEQSKKKQTAGRDTRTRKVELEAGKSMIDEVEELTKKLHGLRVHDVAYSGYYARLAYLAPAVAQHWIAPRSREHTAPVAIQTLGIRNPCHF